MTELVQMTPDEASAESAEWKKLHDDHVDEIDQLKTQKSSGPFETLAAIKSQAAQNPAIPADFVEDAPRVIARDTVMPQKRTERFDRRIEQESAAEAQTLQEAHDFSVENQAALVTAGIAEATAAGKTINVDPQQK